MPRQVPADTGLRALAHFNLDGRARFEVLLEHAEPPGGYLYDSMIAVLVKVLMQPALTGVVIGAQLDRGAGKRRVGVIGDRPIAHCGKHDGHVELQLRREVVHEPARGVAFDLARLFAQEGAGLHRLAQGVDGRVGYLRGVDQDFIPIDRQGLGVAH